MVAEIACGNGTPPSPTVNGAWEFTLTSSALPGTSYEGIANLTQNGSSVTGMVNFDNNPCLMRAALTGKIVGTTVTFQITESGQAVTMNGAVGSTFRSMSGSYTAPAGGCVNGDSGSWAASTE